MKKIVKKSTEILTVLCLPLWLGAAGLVSIDPDAAGVGVLSPVPQAPPGTKAIATTTGKWTLKEVRDPSGVLVPSITLTTTDYLAAKMNFTPRNYATKWDQENAPVFHPQIRASIAFNPKIFQCDGLPLKLWFEDGETMSLGSFICKGNRLITGTDDTDRKAQDNREQDLAKFLLHHYPVAITQGRASLLLHYSLQKDFKNFQQLINPRLNPQYFKQVRKKWNQDIKSGTVGLRVTVED